MSKPVPKKKKQKDTVELLVALLHADDEEYQALPELLVSDADHKSNPALKDTIIGVPGERYLLWVQLENPAAADYHITVSLDGRNDFDPIALNGGNDFEEVVDRLSSGPNSLHMIFGNSIAELPSGTQKPVTSQKMMKDIGTIKIDLGVCTDCGRGNKKKTSQTEQVRRSAAMKQPVLGALKKAKFAAAASTVLVKTDESEDDDDEIHLHWIRKPLRSATLYYDSPMGLILKKRFDEKNPDHVQLLKKYGLSEQKSRADSEADSAAGEGASSSAAAAASSSSAANNNDSKAARQKARHEQMLKERTMAEDDENHRIQQELLAAGIMAEQKKIDEEKAAVYAQEQTALAAVAAKQKKIDEEKAAIFAQEQSVLSALAANKLKLAQQQKELNEKSALNRAAHHFHERELAKKRVKIEPATFPSKKFRHSTDLTDDGKPVVWTATPLEADEPAIEVD